MCHTEDNHGHERHHFLFHFLAGYFTLGPVKYRGWHVQLLIHVACIVLVYRIVRIDCEGRPTHRQQIPSVFHPPTVLICCLLDNDTVYLSRARGLCLPKEVEKVHAAPRDMNDYSFTTGRSG